ncbi:MAG: hypothetical protein FD147_695 [Chloroflexi bacterium]|nr:MAG: hypothetical protein FD147_695 [Chloroflexota bacterium]MBA4376228.1 hypothetical protein [Anaerolinea sp.]
MSREPLFKGLIIDENDRPVSTGVIGSDPCYIVNDAGFMRHILSDPIDLEILKSFGDQINGNEEFIADQTAKMLGQDDLFTHAIIENQLKNIDKKFGQVLQMGLPEETRVYLGMMGFKVVIDIHGEIIRVDQPAARSDEGEGGGDN